MLLAKKRTNEKQPEHQRHRPGISGNEKLLLLEPVPTGQARNAKSNNSEFMEGTHAKL